MNKCENIKLKFADYFDDLIEKEDKEEIENHINQCESCKKEFQELSFLLDSLSNLEEIELPEGYHIDLMKKIEELSEDKVKKFFKKKIIPFKKEILIIAAMLMLVIGMPNFEKIINQKNNLKLNSQVSNLEFVDSNFIAREKYDVGIESNNFMKEYQDISNYISLKNIGKLTSVEVENDYKAAYLEVKINKNDTKKFLNVLRKNYLVKRVNINKRGVLKEEQDYEKNLKIIIKKENKWLNLQKESSNIEEKMEIQNQLDILTLQKQELENRINNLKEEKQYSYFYIEVKQKEGVFKFLEKTFQKILENSLKILELIPYLVISICIFFMINKFKKRHK